MVQPGLGVHPPSDQGGQPPGATDARENQFRETEGEGEGGGGGGGMVTMVTDWKAHAR